MRQSFADFALHLKYFLLIGFADVCLFHSCKVSKDGNKVTVAGGFVKRQFWEVYRNCERIASRRLEIGIAIAFDPRFLSRHRTDRDSDPDPDSDVRRLW
jgi:hypothetical protein